MAKVSIEAINISKGAVTDKVWQSWLGDDPAIFREEGIPNVAHGRTIYTTWRGSVTVWDDGSVTIQPKSRRAEENKRLCKKFAQGEFSIVVQVRGFLCDPVRTTVPAVKVLEFMAM